MTTLGFPTNPLVGDKWTVGSRTWVWTGQGWKIDTGSSSLSSLTVATLVVTTTTNSTGTDSGGLLVIGGVGVGQDMYVGGTIYAAGAEVLTTATLDQFSGNLQGVTDRGSSTTNVIQILNATPSTSSDSGALTVVGGVGIQGDLRVAGEITANKLTIEFTTVTTTIVETDDIIRTLNSTNAVSTVSGALQIAGGAGIQQDLWFGGTLYGPAINIGEEGIESRFNGPLRIQSSTSATDRQSGAFIVAGGVGIQGDLYVGNIYSNGQQVLTSEGGSPNFVSSILPGADISVNTNTGVVTVSNISTLQSVTSRGSSTTNAISITNITPSTSSDSGALTVTGGIGTFGCINAGGQLYASGLQITNPVITSNITGQLDVGFVKITNGQNSFSTDTGALQVLGGIGVDGNIFSTGNIFANGYIVNTGTFTGGTLSAKTTITSTETSTSTTTGALVVTGGVGIGLDVFIGGKINADHIELTGATTSTIAGPLQVSTVLVSNDADSEFTNTGALQVVGGVGVGKNLTVGGTIYAPQITGNFVGTIAATGTVTTSSFASNIIGGGVGDLLYQIGADQTGFLSQPSPGQILVSTDTVPTYQNTLTLAGIVESDSTNTGALVVNGGVGIGQNLNVGGAISGSVLNITSFNTSTFTGEVNASFLKVTFPFNADSSTTGALVVAGGVGIGGDAYIGGTLYVNRALAISTATICGSAVTSIIAGTDTAVSGTTGAVTVWNTSTLETVTSRGATTPNAITITNTSDSNATNSGALQVVGGADIGGNLYVGGEIVASKLTIEFTTVTTTFVQTDDIITTVNLTNSTGTTTGALVVAGGVGIGLDLNVGGAIYIDGQRVATTASVGSLTLQDVTNQGSSTTNPVSITNATGSTSTDSGALTVVGGVGIGENLNVGGAIFINGQEVVTTASISNLGSDRLEDVVARGSSSTIAINITNLDSSTSTTTGALTVAGGVGIGENLNVGGAIFINGQLVVTTASIGNLGTDRLEDVVNRGSSSTVAISIANTSGSTSTTNGALTVAGGVGIGENLNVGGAIFINGQQVVTTSTVDSVSTSTLQDVTNRGSATSNAIRVTNLTNSTSTVSGALIVDGGVGIGRNVNIGGNLFVDGINIFNADKNLWYVSDSIGVDTTATNWGHTRTAPLRTIKYALSLAQSGDAVYIEPGSYSEIFPLTVPQGVTIKGAGLRATYVQPTTATNTLTCFLMNGESTISDLTIGGFFKPGWAAEFAPGAKITTRSPYIERVSVITRGSTVSNGDPYGYDAGDAGNGARLDAALLDPTSLEPALLFNEVTMIVPNATGFYMTNGARAELLNGFTYFAAKGIEAVSGTAGFGGVGRVKLRLSEITGTFLPGDTIYYKDANGNTLASGTIASTGTGGYVYIDGPVWGFGLVYDRTAKAVTPYGTASLSTSTKVFGPSSVSLTTPGDYLGVVSGADFQFGANDYSIDTWLFINSTGTNQQIYYKGTSAESSIRAQVNSNGTITVNHGLTSISSTVALSTGREYHIAVVKTAGAANTLELFIDGTSAASTTGATDIVSNSDPFSIGGYAASTSSTLIGYIDDFRVSNISRYSSTFVPPTGPHVSDDATILLLHFDGEDGSTLFDDDVIHVQNVYSTGVSPATAKRIILADYHQFGAELRCIGSASVFGNQGVIANGTGTDLKLIAYNLAFIGSGKDLSNDLTLTVRANEIIQINNGRIYYQSVDQNGDFRVGDQFYVNQRTGEVSFGTAKVDITSLEELTVTDGFNNAVILPTSISVGDLTLGAGTVSSLTGNITIDPAGTSTIINSNLQVNGRIDAAGDIYANGSRVLTGANAEFVTSITGGTDTVVTTSTGEVVVYNNSTLLTVTRRGSTTDQIITITTTTQADSTQSGALVVTGGLGVGGNVYIGGELFTNGQRVVTTGTINDFANQTVITAGTDTAISTSTGNITIWNTSTLQTITSRGATTNQAISITNATSATSTTTGALIVTGGVGIQGSLFVGGEIVAQKLTIELTTVTTTLVVTDDIIQTQNSTASTGTTTGALVVAGGAGIGGNLNVGGTVTGGGVRTITSSTAPIPATVGDIWYNTNNDRLYRFTGDGVSTFWLDYTGPVVKFLV